MGRANPSFQKRQKEQKRKEKADDKRAARLLKGQAPNPEDQPELLEGELAPEGSEPPTPAPAQP